MLVVVLFVLAAASAWAEVGGRLPELKRGPLFARYGLVERNRQADLNQTILTYVPTRGPLVNAMRLAVWVGAEDRVDRMQLRLRRDAHDADRRAAARNFLDAALPPTDRISLELFMRALAQPGTAGGPALAVWEGATKPYGLVMGKSRLHMENRSIENAPTLLVDVIARK